MKYLVLWEWDTSKMPANKEAQKADDAEGNGNYESVFQGSPRRRMGRFSGWK